MSQKYEAKSLLNMFHCSELNLRAKDVDRRIECERMGTNRPSKSFFTRTYMTLLSITASIIQGSAVGPAAYVVNAAYIVVPAVNICSREVELEHIEKWTAGNNLKINRSKSLEISRRRRTDCSPPPHPITDIRRATSVKIGYWVLQ